MNKVIEFITTQSHLIFENKTIDLKMSLNQYRVDFSSNVNCAIVCYTQTSVLQLLGFKSQSTVSQIRG